MWKVEVKIAPHLIVFFPERLYKVVVDPIRVEEHFYKFVR